MVLEFIFLVFIISITCYRQFILDIVMVEFFPFSGIMACHRFILRFSRELKSTFNFQTSLCTCNFAFFHFFTFLQYLPPLLDVHTSFHILHYIAVNLFQESLDPIVYKSFLPTSLRFFYFFQLHFDKITYRSSRFNLCFIVRGITSKFSGGGCKSLILPKKGCGHLVSIYCKREGHILPLVISPPKQAPKQA